MSTDAKPSNVRELYLQAVRIEEEAARQAFLDDACRGEIELRQRVEGLLAARRAEGDNLLQLATSDSISGQNSFSWNGHDIGKTIDSHPEAMADDRTRDDSVRGQIDISTHPMIANYRLLEELGHGGMGTVYMAAQSKPVKRQVALKVIKPGMDSKEVIARFEAERQALAMMDHPHIARVLDGGTTDEGRPYFVMELVRGIPITEFCKRKTLPLRERLELFVDVCHAVQHAHQKGIIHRDLKPSNIMVTLHDGKPVVKVIDFGVAKALHQELTERTLFTQFSQMLGTPLYMAPEQAEMSGLGVDTRSDIYSLGVVLYELLTGTTPFDRDTMSKLGIDGIRKLIQEQEPPRPSARISTLKVKNHSTIEDQRQLDVDDIAKQLKREVDWIVMKALEKDRERRYETASAFAADIQRYLNDEPVEAYPPTVAYRFGKYTKRHRALLTTVTLLAATLLGAAGVSLSYAFQAETARQQSEVQREKALVAQEKSAENFAAALDAIDKLLKHASSEELAEVPQSQLVRKQIIVDVLEFYRQFKLTTGDSAQLRYRAAVTWTNLAWLSHDLRQHQQAVDALEKTITLSKQLTDEDPANVEFQKAYVEALLTSGKFYAYYLESFDASAHHLNQTGERIEALLQSHPRHAEDWLSLKMDMLSTMSQIAMDADDTEAQLRHARAAYQLLEKYELDESNPVLGGRTTYMFAKASAHTAPDRAAELFQKSLEIRSTLSPNDARRKRVSGRIVRLNAAGNFFVHRDPRLAFEYSTEAIELSEHLVAEFPSVNVYQSRLSGAARVYSKLLKNRTIEPETRLEWAQQFVTRRPDSPTAHAGRAGLIGNGENPVAELTRAIQEYPSAAAYYLKRAHAYYALNKFDEAKDDLDQFVSLSNQSHDALFERGEFYLYQLRDYQMALADFNHSLELHPKEAYRYKRRALAHFRLGQFDDALADIEKSLELSPDDGSALRWIPVDDVAKCLDQSFKDGLVAIADWAVEKNDTPELRVARANLLGAMQFDERAEADFRIALKSESGEDHFHAYYLNFLVKRERWHKALTVIEELNTLAPSEYYPCYQTALLNLYTGDVGKYRIFCERMLSAPYSDVSNGNELGIHFTAWTCALAPDALDDYEPAIRLARQTVEKEPSNQQYINGLGAILMRAGKYEEAQEQLEKALEAGQSDNTSSSYIHYFLSMTEHHLGNAEAAQEHLHEANEIAESELSDSPTWNRRLTLELLRKEAESQIDDPIVDRHVD